MGFVGRGWDCRVRQERSGKGAEGGVGVGGGGGVGVEVMVVGFPKARLFYTRALVFRFSVCLIIIADT